MAFTTFKQLFDKIDETTATFVHDISTRCVAEITPVVTVALILSFIAYGLLIMRGAVGMPVSEFLWKAFRIAIIVNIALAGGLYQSEIAGLIRTLPDDLAKALIISPSQGATAASLIDEAAGAGFGCSADAFNKAGLFSFEGLTYCLIAIIVLFMTVILTGVGGAYLLMAKIALSILAGLGPLFIVALVFPATERFFNLWLGQVINYVLLVVLYAAVFGFMMTIFRNYMVDTKMDGLTNVACTVGGVGILSFSMLIILRQLPSIAASLAGGAALSFERGRRLDNAMEGGGNILSRAGATLMPSRRSSPANSSSSSPVQSQNPQPQASSRLASYGYYKGSGMKATNMN
jgi:type IV secretion system protein VirB6